ncbi:hypothetical protein Q8A67_001245 [Cirrhinus molitorella]|uniref:Ig-like domain-containing protein n=1 Tax=Cirrhinus molitorella TaxID=172907 RepID=A0AA88U7F6_9TELE|nr:hypothetical protein Q8A67_001245 [Cirrhinus molitorella]
MVSVSKVAPLGSSVVLPCYVDELLPMEGLEVEWRRTDSETLVHLYQDGESRSESQQQDYHDRAHLFTDQIQHGNFSLHLDNLKAEDEGRYTCKVYSQQDSGETVVQIKHVERLLVSGSDESISASVGEDITLNCSVDSHITPEHIEEVSWRKTDEDRDVLVLLFQNNETLSDSSDERYRDRAEFFTADIPKGNFSLRLKSVRTEDKGVYMCQVFAGGLSANATTKLGKLGCLGHVCCIHYIFISNLIMELQTVEQRVYTFDNLPHQRVSFSVLHIMVLILCISASGSALILCYMIYCRSHNKDFCLQMFLVLCPNMIMFLAFVLWGVSEGSLNESVSCCAHYILRPLMLLWVAPYINEFKVLFKSAWDKSLNYTKFESVMIICLFVILFLFCLIYMIYLFISVKDELNQRIVSIFRVLARTSFEILPTFQFILLFYAFGSAREGFIIVAVLPVLLTVTRTNWNTVCGEEMGCAPLVRRTVWLVFMFLVNAVVVYFYKMALENEKDPFGWACMIGFLQLLWTLMDFTLSFDWDFHRFVPVYVFGSVGVVVLNSVTLMTELILKTVNGDRSVKDLRIIVFPTEGLFAFALLVLRVFEPWIKMCLQPSQSSAGCDVTLVNGSNQKQNAAESHEMNHLLNQNQEACRRNRRHSV